MCDRLRVEQQDNTKHATHLRHDFPWTTFSANVCRSRVVTGEISDSLVSKSEAFCAGTVDW